MAAPTSKPLSASWRLRANSGRSRSVLSRSSRWLAGCSKIGTGDLLRRARAAGHRGRMVGLDPARGMLRQPEKDVTIEWIRGDLASVTFEDEFDLVVMSGHAFQVLLGDGEICAALRAIRKALARGGSFSFETRNPTAREWEHWNPEPASVITAPDGTTVTSWRRVDAVDGELVSFRNIHASDGWDARRESASTLRFVDSGWLNRALGEARFAVAEQFGNWERNSLAADSPEIITVARAA